MLKKWFINLPCLQEYKEQRWVQTQRCLCNCVNTIHQIAETGGKLTALYADINTNFSLPL